MNKALAYHCESKAEPGHKIGCVLAIDFKHKDGASFISDDAYGHLCTNYGSRWQLDGRYFDGDDRIVSPHHPAQDVKVFTLEATVKPTAFPGTTYMYGILGKTRDGASGYLMMRFGDSTAGGKDVLATAFQATDNTYPDIKGTTHCLLNREYHIAYTYDKENQRGFVDGREEVREPTTKDVKDNDQNLEVGIEASTARYLTGVVANARMLNYPDYTARILSRSIEVRRS